MIPQPSQAGLLDFFWSGEGVGSDAADKLAASINNAVFVLEKIQKNFGKDITSYIEQIDQITKSRLAEALAGGQEIVNDVDGIVKAIADLERQVFFDIEKTIQSTECLAENLSDTVLRTISGATMIGDGADIKIKLPYFMGEAALEISHVELKSAFAAYESVKLAALASLEDIDEGTSPRKIIQIYGDLSSLAIRTTCRYKTQQSIRSLLYADSIAYEKLSRPWAQIMGI
jgi:hypothetical protein